MIAQLKMLDDTAGEVRAAIATARAAQIDWARQPVKDRARLIGSLRPLIAEHTTELARAAAQPANRPLSEKIVSEVLPLAETARFLQANAPRILRRKRYGRKGRPLWLPGHSFTVERQPFGLILIVGPANYPLFIPAAQMLHALAAGNAVLIKPAENCTAPLKTFLERVLHHSAIPSDLVQLLPETPAAAHEAARSGIDKAIFTGSSENGRAFLAELAQQNIPSIMELSGADAVFVRADANIELAVKAIAFGLRLNAGDTCMAPHAIIVHHTAAVELAAQLRERGIGIESVFVARNDAHALEIAGFDAHGLGAAVFSRDETAARAFARQLKTGFVTINDLIVPTADPRFPFGGVRASGFGCTRGEEGLLEMTYPQAIARRRGRFHQHLESPAAGDAELFAEFVRLTHGRGWRRRLHSLGKLFRLARQRMRASRTDR